MDINQLFFLGTNKYGQAGIGQKNHYKSYNQPKSYAFPVFVRQISCGAHHSALLTLDGQVYTMGSNIHGALGSNPSLNYSFVPTLVQDLDQIEKIDCGPFHMAAVSKGCLFTWGKGIDGQLGHGNTKNISKPTKVDSIFEQVERVSCGTNHTLVLTKKNQIYSCYAFGNGIYGQLGTGQSRNSYTPAKVKLENVDMMSAGDNHSLFLVNGTVYACGDNSNCQLGTVFNKKFMSQPTKVQFQENTGKISVIQAKKYSAALTQSGQIYVWGLKANFGQPKMLKSKDNFCQQIYDIRISNQAVYGLTTSGALYAWNIQKGQQIDKYWVCNTEKILDNGRPIFDFSTGEGYILILGDIIKQIQIDSNIPINLSVIEDSDLPQTSRKDKQNEKQYLKNYQKISQSQLLNEKQSLGSNLSSRSVSKVPSLKLIQKSSKDKENIVRQHLDRVSKQKKSKILGEISNTNNIPSKSTSIDKKRHSFEISKSPAPIKCQSLQIPLQSCEFEENTFQLVKTPSSSILIQPCNFLKQSHRQDILNQQKYQKNNFTKNKNQEQMKENNYNNLNHINFNNKIRLADINQNKKSQISVKKYQKIDQVLDLLQKSNSISSKISQCVIQEEKGKQSQIIKTNRILRVQLKQKQLKISQLQQLLSRKQMQIEAQRQIIKVLRQKNNSTYTSIKQ